MQGDRVSGARKPATLETGKVVQVPLFVNAGDRVKVDTRTGEYITRVVSRRATAVRHGLGDRTSAPRRPRAGPLPAVRGRDEGRPRRRASTPPRWSPPTSSTPAARHGVGDARASELDGAIAAHAEGWTLAAHAGPRPGRAPPRRLRAGRAPRRARRRRHRRGGRAGQAVLHRRQRAVRQRRARRARRRPPQRRAPSAGRGQAGERASFERANHQARLRPHWCTDSSTAERVTSWRR